MCNSLVGRGQSSCQALISEETTTVSLAHQTCHNSRLQLLPALHGALLAITRPLHVQRTQALRSARLSHDSPQLGILRLALVLSSSLPRASAIPRGAGSSHKLRMILSRGLAERMGSLWNMQSKKCYYQLWASPHAFSSFGSTAGQSCAPGRMGVPWSLPEIQNTGDRHVAQYGIRFSKIPVIW